MEHGSEITGQKFNSDHLLIFIVNLMFDYIFVHVHINYSRALISKNHENKFFLVKKWETHHIFKQPIVLQVLFLRF